MLLILINWIYIFFICLGIGILFSPFIFKEQNKLAYVLIIGLFFEFLFLHFIAFITPTNFWFYLGNFIFAAISIFLNLSQLKLLFSEEFKKWRDLKTLVKLSFFFFFLLCLMQSASSPYIPDNESYYLQSIKWINEYGLVKGLANLNILYGQMSGWHILQSAFNFGNISNSFNDINGFLMFICSYIYINHLDHYFKEKKLIDLFLGLIPLGNLLYFQFINTPSPDLPIYLFTPIIFYLFYNEFQSSENNYRFIILLCCFLILIKITIVPILLLPLFLLFKFKHFKKNLCFSTFLGILSLFAFTFKNFIISGYIFYPTNLFENWIHPDWRISEIMLGFYYHASKMSAFSFFNTFTTGNYSAWEVFKIWLLEPNLRSFFNISIIILLLIFPFFIKKNRTLQLLYIYAILQFIFIYLSSPQFRFFIPLIACMSTYIVAKIFQNKLTFIKYTFLILCFIPAVPLFVTINVNSISNNKFTRQELTSLELKNIVYPSSNSQYNFNFKKIKEGNFEYYSPNKNEVLYWITGDGPLPCINEIMIEELKKNYHIRPQLRSNKLNDGFRFENLNR